MTQAVLAAGVAPIPAPQRAGVMAALALRASALAVWVYLAASLAYAATEGGVYVRLAQATGLGLLALHGLWPRRDEWPVHAVLAVAVLGFALRLHFQHLTSASALLHVLAAAGAAIAFVRTPPSTRLLRFAVYGCAIFLILRIADGAFPETVFLRRSGNHISVMMLAPALLASVEEARRGERLRLLPAVLTALACTWALGRAGIVVSYAYLGFVLWARRGSFGRVTPWLVTGAAIVAVIPYALRNWWLAELWVYSLFMKFRTKSVTEDPRFRVMSEYVESLNLSDLLLGHEPIFVSHLGLSLHNSFLQWHFNFGAGALVIVLVTVAAIVTALRRGRTFIALALVVILARAFSDTVLLSGLFDLPFLVCLVLGLRAHEPGHSLAHSRVNV